MRLLLRYHTLLSWFFHFQLVKRDKKDLPYSFFGQKCGFDNEVVVLKGWRGVSSTHTFPRSHSESLPLLCIDCRRNKLHRVWGRGRRRVVHLERIVLSQKGEFF